MPDETYCTPILAYVLQDSETKKIDIYKVDEAHELIKEYGGINCEFKEKNEQIPPIAYIKMNDGTRMQQYVMSVV